MYKKRNIVDNNTHTVNSVLVVFGLVIAMYFLKDIAVPLILAGLLSFLLLPVNEFLEKLHFPRPFAIIVSLFFAISLLTLFGYLAYTQIIELEGLLPKFVKKGSEILMNLNKFTKNLLQLNTNQLENEGQKYMGELLKEVPNLISQTLGTTSSFLINLSLMPLYIFLFLLYRDFLKTFLFKLLKNTPNPQIENILYKINDVVRSYLVGLLLVILIVGILNTAALMVLGIDQAIFFGFFAAILVLIPYIGIAIGSALPIIVALVTKDSYWYALGVAGSFGIVQFLEGNFITPNIVGSKVSINSLIALVSLLLFGSLWGVAGLILALPLTAVLKIIFDYSIHYKAWGFLLGDIDHKDVKKAKSKYFF